MPKVQSINPHILPLETERNIWLKPDRSIENMNGCRRHHQIIHYAINNRFSRWFWKHSWERKCFICLSKGSVVARYVLGHSAYSCRHSRITRTLYRTPRALSLPVSLPFRIVAVHVHVFAMAHLICSLHLDCFRCFMWRNPSVNEND